MRFPSAVLLSALGASGLGAQDPPAGPHPYEARLAWWARARLGLFVHWGPVSQRGTEIGWSRGAQVPVADYDALHRTFDPQQFDAAAWAELAAAAGAGYLVLTTKHHDGFCLWDSELTDYSIAHTPFRRDVTRELADACRKAGLRFCAYHSICDWRHPDYPLGSPGGKSRKPSPDMDRYEQYLRGQLRELFTDCGPLGLVWFDGEWEAPWTAERGEALYRFCRSLQGSVIVNNRVGKARQGMAGTSAPGAGPIGDYDTPEQEIGRYQDQRPWESCITICRQWAWKPDDTLKSLAECVQTLVRCAGGDGNLLLNVGPMPDGRIEPRQAERLRELGGWLSASGEAVRDTRGGPWLPSARVVSTRRGRSVYVHVLQWPGETIELPDLPARIAGSAVLGGGKATVRQEQGRIVLQVPAAARQPIDTIVRLELDTDALALAPIAVPAPMAFARASASNVFRNEPGYGADRAIDGDPATRWATDAGTKQATLEIDLGAPKRAGGVAIAEWRAGARVQRFDLQCELGGEWRTVLAGESIGADFRREFSPVEARRWRLRILDSSEGPTIEEFELLFR
ncbi:MAG: hypothetical protein FJ265_15295 [Planctomycetes bacterium]|nr:hypothetical protein [Planctomycetota bacterium]